MAQLGPLIVVVGETGAGKSTLAIELARKFNGEIISADSWAVYKQLDIGTAKPSSLLQQEIKHHCIDMVEPDGDYTAAEFKKDALIAIADIESRTKLPIIVGGTGLYIDSVVYDFSFAKQGDRDKRLKLALLSIKQLVELAQKEGYDLQGVDLRNKRRLIRVIETKGEVPTKKDLRQNTLIIGIKVERSKLRQNIVSRVEQMFRAGLRKEIATITNKYGWDCEGMQGIGYKEFKQWQDGEISMGKVKSKIVYNTLQLAKRQRTWFKRNQNINWVDSLEQAVKLTDEHMLRTLQQ